MSKIKTDEGTLVHLMIIVFAFWLCVGLTLLRLSAWGQIDEPNSIELIDNTNKDCINHKNTSQ